MKNRTVISVVMLTGVLMAGLALVCRAEDAPATAPKPVKTGGILTTDQNQKQDFLMMLTDGEDKPVKYVFAGGFDKKTVEGIFSCCRILVTYTQNEDGTRKLLTIQKAKVPAAATVTGTVVATFNDFWVAVKFKDGTQDGYARGAKDVTAQIKALGKGDTVKIQYTTDGERHRISSIEVVAKAPAASGPAGGAK